MGIRSRRDAVLAPRCPQLRTHNLACLWRLLGGTQRFLAEHFVSATVDFVIPTCLFQLVDAAIVASVSVFLLFLTQVLQFFASADAEFRLVFGLDVSDQQL